MSAPGSEAQGDFDDAYRALQLATADTSLDTAEHEELALIGAKLDMRRGDVDNDRAMLLSARQKFVTFLRTSRNAAFISEARGWLARVTWLVGDHTAAGKMYLDELNRDGSNLSRETLLNSLRLGYGYDGGTALREHIEEYFDTAAHAHISLDDFRWRLLALK